MREWLVKKRKARALSQKEVAEFCGISKSYYEKIERGERNVPVKTAKKIANFFQFNWILFYD